MLVQIVLILIDRYIYLSKVIQKLKAKGDRSNALIFECDNTTHNQSLLWKFFFHWFQLIFIHIFTFWVLTNSGTRLLAGHPECTKSDIDSDRCNEVWSNTFILTFYLLYCGYFACSALQIREGWPKLEDVFIKRRANVVSKTYTMGYFLVPFVWELEQVVSWLWIKTSLDLFQWFKLEEVYSNLYITKCTNKSRRVRGVGRAISIWWKLVMGGGILLLLLLIIAPILLFSNLNPMAELNPIKKSYMSLSLEFEGAFSFELFKTSRAELHKIDDRKEYEDIKKLEAGRRADPGQIQVVKFPSFSDSYIFFTDNVRTMMLQMLLGDVNAVIDLTYTFNRPVSGADR